MDREHSARLVLGRGALCALLGFGLIAAACTSSSEERTREVQSPTAVPASDRPLADQPVADPTEGSAHSDDEAASDSGSSSAGTDADPQPSDDDPPATPDEVPTVPAPIGAPPDFAGVDQAAAGPILISGDQAVVLTPGEEPMVVVDSPVAVALDDAMGGLLLQDTPVWPGSGRSSTDSIVWWVPAGASAAQELLVPAQGQYIDLHDVAVIDGIPTALYVRRVGDNPSAARHTLRTVDLDTREVRELAVVGGWEAGLSSLSVGGGRIVTNWYAEISHGIDLRDATGENVAPPEPTEAIFEDFYDCTECPKAATLTPDGAVIYFTETNPTSRDGRSAFVESLVGVDLVTGRELTRVELPGRGDGLLDAARGYVLVNGWPSGSPAHLVDVASGSVTTLPVTGTARFMQSPLAISTVESPFG